MQAKSRCIELSLNLKSYAFRQFYIRKVCGHLLRRVYSSSYEDLQSFFKDSGASLGYNKVHPIPCASVYVDLQEPPYF